MCYMSGRTHINPSGGWQDTGERASQIPAALLPCQEGRRRSKYPPTFSISYQRDSNGQDGHEWEVVPRRGH
jgi:hypothetical protein